MERNKRLLNFILPTSRSYGTIFFFIPSGCLAGRKASNMQRSIGTFGESPTCQFLGYYSQEGKSKSNPLRV
jgi:hypothetical protein